MLKFWLSICLNREWLELRRGSELPSANSRFARAWYVPSNLAYVHRTNSACQVCSLLLIPTSSIDSVVQYTFFYFIFSKVIVGRGIRRCWINLKLCKFTVNMLLVWVMIIRTNNLLCVVGMMGLLDGLSDYLTYERSDF